MNFEGQDIPIFNLDYVFNKAYAEASDEQRKSIPIDLQHKIAFKKKDPSFKLKYYEKVKILTMNLGYQYFNILYNPKEEGINDKIFYNLVKASKGKIKNYEMLSQMDSDNMFVLSDAQIAKALTYASHIQCGNIHNLIKDYKYVGGMGKRANTKAMDNMSGIIKFLSSYQSKVGTITSKYNLMVSDFGCLMMLYNNEYSVTDMRINGFPNRSVQSAGLRRGVYALVKRGYVDRRGAPKNAKYILSSSGINIVHKIIDELFQSY